MNFKKILIPTIYFIVLYSFSQDNLHIANTLDPVLKENANSVIRSNEVEVTMESTNKMLTKVKRVITVLSRGGNNDLNAYIHYDNNVKIKNLEALIFNAFGKEIKKFKKNDFNDISAVDGGTLYSDSRVKYLEYTPISYPYTLELTYETINTSTAFLPSFSPIDGYYMAVENSSYTINYPSQIEIRKKEKNFENIDVKREETIGRKYYKVKNIYAIKPEQHSPTFKSIIPRVMFSASQFSLEGVSAEVKDWNDFGKWMYNDLIKDAYDLSPSTITIINDLVKNETTDIDKAKKIYKYVQDKTRYISVQVGIGGWKPFNASEVDKLGYGDCKGLTNYTMSLLKAVGIESYYSVVSSGSSQQNIETDFASMQGNHVILSVPIDEKTLWLECTSQKLPFGFLGDFTDDRDVLVIKPEGAEIKHTKKYTTEESTQTIKGNYEIGLDGSIAINAKIESKGIQYDNKYYLDGQPQRDLEKYYKKHWNYINNIDFSKIDLKNNKDEIEFSEYVNFKAINYATTVGDRMLITLNALNRNTHIPNRYRDRKLPLKINRGFADMDEIEITLPEGYKIEAIFENKIIENKFGKYKISVEEKDNNKLFYKREFVINDGEFPKEDYETYRSLYKEVAKYDNSKITIIKN